MPLSENMSGMLRAPCDDTYSNAWHPAFLAGPGQFFPAKRNHKRHERRAAARFLGRTAAGCAFRDERSASVKTHTALARPRGSRGAHPAPVRPPRNSASASAGLAQPAAHPGALTASPARAAAASRRAPCERCTAPRPLRRRRGNGPAGAGGPPAPGAWLLSVRWP